MTVRFVDTSLLVRAYLIDELGHDRAHELVFASTDPVVASELAPLELEAALGADGPGGAGGAAADSLRAQAIRDLGGLGPVLVLRTQMGALVTRARELLRSHPLRSLDALHLACADTDARRLAAGDPIAFLTADEDQRRAAAALGLATDLI